MDDKDFYSPDEVAERLGLHVRTVRRFIREGKLRAVRVGKQYRIASQDLNELVGAREAQAAGASPSRRRRIIVSTTVDIDAIGSDEVQRVTTALTGTFGSASGGPINKRLDCIYYEEQGQLRIVINADLEVVTAVLGLVNSLVRSTAEP